MNKIIVEGMQFHAYHGCNVEEAKLGGDYLVDVIVETDFIKPVISDKIADAVDYVVIYELTKKEMSVRSNLIEHAATRIYNAIKKRYPDLKTITVKVKKLSPPIGGRVTNVCALISK
jgi:7,8-dihydroneopterin aldolase/epimerase/oxygenase